MVARERQAFDPTGHYSRPDIFRVEVTVSGGLPSTSTTDRPRSFPVPSPEPGDMRWHCCIEPSGEAGTTDLPVGSWRHVQTAPSGPPKSSQRRRPAEVERRRTARFTARPSRDRSMQQCRFNVSGHPAVTLPAGLTPDRLPAGIQLIAGHGHETLLYRLASALELTRVASHVRRSTDRDPTPMAVCRSPAGLGLTPAVRPRASPHAVRHLDTVPWRQRVRTRGRRLSAIRVPLTIRSQSAVGSRI